MGEKQDGREGENCGFPLFVLTFLPPLDIMSETKKAQAMMQNARSNGSAAREGSSQAERLPGQERRAERLRSRG